MLQKYAFLNKIDLHKLRAEQSNRESARATPEEREILKKSKELTLVLEKAFNEYGFSEYRDIEKKFHRLNRNFNYKEMEVALKEYPDLAENIRLKFHECDEKAQAFEKKIISLRDTMPSIYLSWKKLDTYRSKLNFMDKFNLLKEEHLGNITEWNQLIPTLKLYAFEEFASIIEHYESLKASFFSKSLWVELKNRKKPEIYEKMKATDEHLVAFEQQLRTDVEQEKIAKEVLDSYLSLETIKERLVFINSQIVLDGQDLSASVIRARAGLQKDRESIERRKIDEIIDAFPDAKPIPESIKRKLYLKYHPDKQTEQESIPLYETLFRHLTKAIFIKENSEED